jgi:DNA-binding NarL/FixJ family response regulator
MVGKVPNGGDPVAGYGVLASMTRAARQLETPARQPGPRARTPIRILLIDPRPLTAAAVRRFLESATDPGQSVRFAVTAVPSADAVSAEDRFEILLLHVSPAADVGAELEACLRVIPAAHRSVPTVVFSDCTGAADIAAAVRGGALGYLPSTLDSAEIVEALRLLASGLAVLPPDALVLLADGPRNRTSRRIRHPETLQDTPPCFTARERDVFRGLRDGKPNKVIARELSMSHSTVKVHVRGILRKLGVQNRTEAALAAARILPRRPDRG